MTVIDASAIVAAAEGEPEEDAVLDALAQADDLRMSAATWLEIMIAVDSRRSPVLVNDMEEFLGNVQIEPVTERQAAIARRAFEQYGLGSGSSAALTYSDCLAYALAKDRREPLLYAGDRFSYTDLAPPL